MNPAVSARNCTWRGCYIRLSRRVSARLDAQIVEAGISRFPVALVFMPHAVQSRPRPDSIPAERGGVRRLAIGRAAAGGAGL